MADSGSDLPVLARRFAALGERDRSAIYDLLSEDEARKLGRLVAGIEEPEPDDEPEETEDSDVPESKTVQYAIYSPWLRQRISGRANVRGKGLVSPFALTGKTRETLLDIVRAEEEVRAGSQEESAVNPSLVQRIADYVNARLAAL